MKRILIFFCIVFSILIAGCGERITPGSNSSADWAYNFVVWNDDIYEALEIQIESEKINKEIGEVKQYSDFEGTYGNGFSNKYSVGTKLYSIKDIDTSEYIAIKTEEGKFIKAEGKGKYGE